MAKMKLVDMVISNEEIEKLQKAGYNVNLNSDGRVVYDLPDKEKVVIGRSKSCDLHLPPGENRGLIYSEDTLKKAMTMSNRHCVIVPGEKQIYNFDALQKNTRVHDVGVHELGSLNLLNGIDVHLGDYELRVRYE